MLNIQVGGAADLSDDSKSSLADLFESIQEGVVQITKSSGSASRFIITSNGRLLTNEHVVSGESSVAVWTSNLTEQLYACNGGWNDFGMQSTSYEAICIVSAGLKSRGWRRCMTTTRRPRVAAIGLDSSQVASIAPLCGELRADDWLGNYLGNYSWTETDVLVAGHLGGHVVDSSVNVMTIGPTPVVWTDSYQNSRGGFLPHYSNTNNKNTERELAVHPNCPALYKPLASELCRQLGRATEPSDVMDTSWKGQKTVLIETTSGLPVALRLVLPTRQRASDGEPSRPIALLLPRAANLVAWFRAFLCELHESDTLRVPHAPPRLSQPSDWYTPQEKALADRISQIESEFECLSSERDQLQQSLAAEGERADRGIRRVLWADGDDLVAAVRDMLTALGFAVRDMDAELRQDEPRREDLRLTLQDVSDWQAIVEVKGYTSGIRTSDTRQIREHRDRYVREEGRYPDLTMWLSNPYRTLDPSSRSAPDQNVKDTAEIVGAVHVLASDLYRQWALVAADSLDSEAVVQSLKNADPGLWTPPSPSSGT